jgi:pimeloyl-ACP methyl ester carboxylesterase
MVMDGPFAETKELIVGYWPARTCHYASVNGLRMYYQVHGTTGRPLVLLHGGLGTIETAFGNVLSNLARSRQVIAVEQQAHGRTADIDRRLTYEQMADDTAELLRQLNIEQADFFGYSMGASVALQVGVRHPGLARKLAVASGGYRCDGYKPELFNGLRTLESTIEGQYLQQIYQRVAPRPEQWSSAVNRIRNVLFSDPGLRRQDLRSIRAPTLFVAGREGVVRPEHTHEMCDLVPHAQLAVVSGHDHDAGMVGRSASLLPAFLDAPDPGRLARRGSLR